MQLQNNTATSNVNSSQTKNILKKLTHDRNFTIIDNSLLRSEKLSWKAKGLAAYLLSLPEDWVIIITELAKHGKDGLASVKSAMKELKFAGYIQTIKYRNAKGQITGWQTLIREDLNIPFPTATGLETQGLHPEVDFPHVDNPLVDNRPLLSTNDTKDEFNEELILCKDSENKNIESRIPKDELIEMFTHLWGRYPLKKGREKAKESFLKCFKGLKKAPAIELAKIVIAQLAAHLAEHEAKTQIKNQGADIWIPELPMLSTWLNQKRWNDEYATPEQILKSAKRKSAVLDLDSIFAGAI